MKTKKEKIGGGCEIPKGMRKKAYLFCYLMLIPCFWGLFSFFYVNAYSILIAFTDGTPFKDPFTFSNFKLLFYELSLTDSILYVSLLNTFKYFALTLVKLFLSYIIAYFLYKKIPGHGAFSILFFLPSIIAPVITVNIFKNIIGEFGPLWILVRDWFNYEYSDFLANPDTATNVILIYCFISGFGSTFLILLGTLNRLPQEYTEAAQIDGCRQWTEFWHIITPLCWDTLSTYVVLSLTGIFMSTGPILYFTGGQYNTYTLAYWIFDRVKFGGDYSYASAVGIFFTVLSIPIVFGVRYLMSKADPEVSY